MKLFKHSMNDKLGGSDHSGSAEPEMMKQRFARFTKLLLDLQCSYNLKCHYQSLCNCIWPKLKVGTTKAREEGYVEKGNEGLLSVCDYIQEFAPIKRWHNCGGEIC
ncbi:hypothetical protein DEO72_LG10g2681 [Vigna unguiculata]|uniref:Uncharacterized protein n=1 Tax=Vigna unguiculata TaxID=3917 RepID=A0A4D6NDM3_VIGUN|nr:hypothetical protein DEO72_LG10g2681 [Vigna unguiculata]